MKKKVTVAQLCWTLCNSMDYIVHGILQARILEWVSPGGLPNVGMEHRSPTLQADFLPAEPQGKPKNTGVGSLSLLWWIFQQTMKELPQFYVKIYFKFQLSKYFHILYIHLFSWVIGNLLFLFLLF